MKGQLTVFETFVKNWNLQNFTLLGLFRVDWEDLAQALTKLTKTSCLSMAAAPVNPDDGIKGFDLQGMAVEWERDENIRTHLRLPDSVMFPHGTSECIKTACQPEIHGFLKPLLLGMVELDGKPQPPVDPLREQIALLYQTFSKKVQDEQVVYDSWMCRKFLGLVKMKARKHMPSTDFWLNNRQFDG